ncbi:DUF72 domain-containing protein [candidate division KSB1 bacterium]|nr:DUF72 domain-containing protein [candidate division KSB1 bacterium]
MDQKIFIGPAGWSYPDWKHAVYPTKLPRGVSELTYLSNYFNLVEVNSTFYRYVDETITKRWLCQVRGNESFRFTCKLHQNFTHQREAIDKSAIASVKSGFAPLLREGRLLALLLQFPWSFKNSAASREWLKRLFDEFNDFPLALEVRHKSWDHPSLLHFLTEHSVSFVNIDQPLIGDASLGFTTYTTGGLLYVRFHGRNAEHWFNQESGRNARYDYLYSKNELDSFIEELSHLVKMGKTIVLVYNNHFRGQAVVNALQMKAELMRSKVPVPGRLVETYPQLKSIASSTAAAEGTMEMFGEVS